MAQKSLTITPQLLAEMLSQYVQHTEKANIKPQDFNVHLTLPSSQEDAARENLNKIKKKSLPVFVVTWE